MQNLPLFISIAGNIGGVLLSAVLAIKLVGAREDVAALEEVREGLKAYVAELKPDAELGAQVRRQRADALEAARAANAKRKAG